MTIEELDFTIHDDTRYRMGREAEEDTDEWILGIARKGSHAMLEERCQSPKRGFCGRLRRRLHGRIVYPSDY